MRSLVVGYGHMGRFHRRVLTDLGHDVRTLDPNLMAGADWRRLPTGHHFDVVCIATPIEHLAEQAAWWSGQARYLLIEKPMAATLEQATELQGVLHWQPTAVGYVERFNPRVQQLREQLEGTQPAGGVFHRWNTRPSSNVPLDLTSHDVDLANFLNVPNAVFDSRAEAQWKTRRILIGARDRRPLLVADLMDHSANPLTAQWQAFLSDGQDVAKPDDAVRVLHQIENTRVAVAA